MKSNKINKEKIKAWLTKTNIFIAVLSLMVIIQFLQLQGVLKASVFLEGRDSSLIEEIGQVKESYQAIGNDLKEVRNYLRLPSGNYGEFEEQESENENENKDDLQLALFKYIDQLSLDKELSEDLQANKIALQQLKDSPNFRNILSESKLSISELTENEKNLNLNIKDGEIAIASFILSKEDGGLSLKTAKGIKEFTESSVVNFEKEMGAYFQENSAYLKEHTKKLEAQKKEIQAAIALKPTKDVLVKMDASLDSTLKESGTTLFYEITNKTGEVVGEILLDTATLKITLVDKKKDSATLEVSQISTALIPFLEKLDTKTLIERKADKSLQSLEKTFADSGFKLLLKENGLKMKEGSREYQQRIYFDLYDKNDKHISSITVEKATGVVNVVQPDGTNAENILFFDPEFKKKTLEIPKNIPKYSDVPSKEDGTFNILVAGKHGSLLDTMIFVHIEEEPRTIRMISIPRDLHYAGRKINSYAHYYGMSELVKVLSNISGYQLDKYILIDMYAFIDVINLIGGIDITLPSAVIDPTYRAVDNGVEGTLHFEAGDHHLNGVQALRLARTRHTSSDFARAERQQLILKSLQNKAQNFGFGDADTIYEMAKAVLAKTETDISLDEAIAYYFRYQNYSIESMDVMTSGNILFVPPYTTKEQCASLVATAEASGQAKPGCENENQAYTLLPKDNNWDIIKWFFEQKFETE